MAVKKIPFNSPGQEENSTNLNEFTSKKALNWYCLGLSKAGKGFRKQDILVTENTSSMRALWQSSQSYAGNCLLPLHRLHVQRSPQTVHFRPASWKEQATPAEFFFLNNFIYLPVSAGTAECVRRVIYAQPLLMYHFLVQTKLQSLTKRELQSTSLKELPNQFRNTCQAINF